MRRGPDRRYSREEEHSGKVTGSSCCLGLEAQGSGADQPEGEWFHGFVIQARLWVVFNYQDFHRLRGIIPAATGLGERAILINRCGRAVK